MKLHERYFTVEQIKCELDKLVIEFLIKHQDELTQGEEIKILTEVFSTSLGCVAKEMIRMERHDDPDKKGDEA